MKRKYFRNLAVVVCCLMVLSTTVFATEVSETRASAQISAYFIEVTTDPGRINVEFSVTGTGIDVYKRQTWRWRKIPTIPCSC